MDSEGNNRRLKETIEVSEEEASSGDLDASMLERLVTKIKNFKASSSRIDYSKHDMVEMSEEEETKSTEFEVVESESETIGKRLESKTEGMSRSSGEASSEASGYMTDEGRRFPQSKREVIRCGNVKVVRMGYKRNKNGEIYAVIYKCKGQELELPYIDEGSVQELYEALSEKDAGYIVDMKLSEEKEKTMGAPTFLSTFSSVKAEQEEDLRTEYEIPEEYKITFLGGKTLASEIPEGSLVVYIAQMKAGLRFPMHPLFKDVLRF